MKKIIALTLLLCTLTLLLSSCGSSNDVKIEKPEDTNLEYWLLDTLDTDNLTEINRKSDDNKKSFLAKEYKAATNENGEIVAPQAAVVYTLGRYPFTDFGVRRIINIMITDPDVYVWGLTLNSTRDEFVEVMNSLGFELSVDSEKSIEFSNGRYSVVLFYGDRLIIRYRCSTIKYYIY